MVFKGKLIRYKWCYDKWIYRFTTNKQFSNLKNNIVEAVIVNGLPEDKYKIEVLSSYIEIDLDMIKNITIKAIERDE